MEVSTSQTSVPEASPSRTPTAASQTEISTTSSPAVDYQLFRVAPESLGDVWGEIGDLMHDVANADYTGLTMQSLLDDIKTGRTELWAIARDKVVALGGTAIMETPRGDRELDIKFLVGTEMNKWTHTLEALEGYARHHGCKSIEMIARKGWAKKLPDYKITSIIMKKEL